MKVGTGVGLPAGADDDTVRGVGRTDSDRWVIAGLGLTGRVILGSGDAVLLGAGDGVVVGEGVTEGVGEGVVEGVGDVEGVTEGVVEGVGDGDGSCGVSEGGSAMLCTLGPESFVDRLGAEVWTNASASDGSAGSAVLCALRVESLQVSLHVEVVADGVAVSVGDGSGEASTVEISAEASGVGVDVGPDSAKDVRAGTVMPIAVTPTAVTDTTTRRSTRCIRVPLSAPGSLTPHILSRNLGHAPPGPRAGCRRSAVPDVIRGVRARSDLRECP